MTDKRNRSLNWKEATAVRRTFVIQCLALISMDSKNFLSLGCKNLPKLHLLYSVGLMSSSNHFCPALELKGGVWPVCMEDNPRAEQLRKNCFLEVVKGEGAFSSLYISKTTIYCFVFPPAPTFIYLVFIAHTKTYRRGDAKTF